MEYALGGDPVGQATGTSILPKTTRDTHGSLQLSFTRYTDRTGLNTHTKEEGREFFRIVPDKKRRLAVLANPAPVKKSTSRSCEHFTGGISDHTLYYFLPPMKSRVKSRHDL
ncbi:MAG: hypothetical protein WCP45_14440 [Verrucomicrobiota bacterium]